MAYSWQESVKPAGTQDIQCDIEYLDKSYIHVYLDGAETTAFTWTSSTNIRLNSALSAETVVLLIRKTEREYLYIEFASGAPFIEGNVDTQNTQFLHLAQELVEGRAIPGFYGDISMNGYRITNLKDPTSAQDAATKHYVDTADTALGARIDAEYAGRVAAVEEEASIREANDIALGARIDVEHAGRVAAVAAEAATRKAADDALSARTTNLEQTFISDVVTVSYPWYTVLEVATDTVTPEIPFSKAIVYLNGVAQVPGYSFEVVDGTLLFAEILPAGTLVAARLGADVEAGDGYTTEAAFDNLVSSLGVLAYKGAAAAVADSTDTSNVAVQLNALLASLRAAGIINT